LFLQIINHQKKTDIHGLSFFALSSDIFSASFI